MVLPMLSLRAAFAGNPSVVVVVVVVVVAKQLQLQLQLQLMGCFPASLLPAKQGSRQEVASLSMALLR